MKTIGCLARRVTVFASLFVAHSAQAQSIDFPLNFGDFQTSDIKETIENIVRIVFGFLGILIIVAIIYGGFKVIVSRGDSDEVGKGRKILTSGAIGLLILFGAYAIAGFIIDSLSQAL